MSNARPTYAELITVFENSATVRSIGLTEKRIDVLLEALRIADAGVVDATVELLQYNGGWDLKDEQHPIVKARRALERAGVKL